MSARQDRSQIFLRLSLGEILAVVVALDILEDGLHLLGLALPLVLGHLGLPPEELLVGLAVAATQTVPEGGELAVVVVEVEMVHGVAGGAVDDGAVGDVLAVVDEDGPEVDEAEEEDVGELLQREDEGEDVVGDALRPAVERVEGVRGEGAGHDPLVVRLVQGLVDQRVVEAAVNPVDAEIGEGDEQRELDDAVVREGLFGEGVVELRVSADFGDEEGGRQEGHDGHGLHGLLDLHGDLVLEELGVLDGGLVPDENVGEGGGDEVGDDAENPAERKLLGTRSGKGEGGRRLPDDEEKAEELAIDVVSGPGAHVGVLGGLQIEQLGGGLVGVRVGCAEERQRAVGGIGEVREGD